MNGKGDPLTYLLPSKGYAFRGQSSQQQLRERLHLPNVPVMPIGYRDAIKIFQKMKGQTAPVNFVAGFENVNFRHAVASNRGCLKILCKSLKR